MDALEKHEEQELKPLDAQNKFMVKDLKTAIWAMRRLQILNKDDAEKELAAKNEINRIQHWLEKEKQGNETFRDYLKDELSEYLYEQRKSDPRFKISTPYGTVSTRKSRAGVTWPDDKQLVESLTKQGLDEFIRTKQEPDKAAIQKRFKFVGNHYVDPETGIVIEGARPKPTTETTTFKINE